MNESNPEGATDTPRSAHVGDADLARARERLNASLGAVKARANATADAADRFVRTRPWTAIGIAALTAVLVGRALRGSRPPGAYRAGPYIGHDIDHGMGRHVGPAARQRLGERVLRRGREVSRTLPRMLRNVGDLIEERGNRALRGLERRLH